MRYISSMNDTTMVKIGVLALQGAFVEHIKLLQRLGVEAVEVRKAAQLEGLDGLIIPGGESTTVGMIAERWGLVEPLRHWVHSGQPTWGTCAGMILLAERAIGQKQGGQPLLGGLDVTVNRNYFGRQTESFETWLTVPQLGDDPVPAVFIRAPAITEAGSEVERLAELALPDRETVLVAVRQGAILATAFHPELTQDTRWHLLFLAMMQSTKG
jgi:pyridoxal 5'-phosphate synthase pdxT subunit